MPVGVFLFSPCIVPEWASGEYALVEVDIELQ
jgi:hypothetical protein